jgi:hypothetical protein
MRFTAAALLSLLVLLGACATRPDNTASCELASVPKQAVLGVRQGMDVATWPPEISRSGPSCQRVWFGERQHPEAMQVLATYYFEDGRVKRLAGRVPAGAAYDCHYLDGSLDTARSQNAAQCPKASEVNSRN